MRCATSDADRRVNGVEQRRKGDATNDRFLLLATMEWRIRANRRTDGFSMQHHGAHSGFSRAANRPVRPGAGVGRTLIYPHVWQS